MKKKLKGFTLVEVALFLAVTGALFVGIAVGTQNSIFQQRFTDAVQNYAEFLRSVYSEVLNVQTDGTGRSDKIVYGKLVTFGESRDLAGCPVNGNGGTRGENCKKESGTVAIFSYNVIAKATDGADNVSLLEMMKGLNANVVMMQDEAYAPVGFTRDYTPRWASAIQKTENSESFVGALLILRHPRSGVVYTYVMRGETIDVNAKIIEANNTGKDKFNPLSKYLNDNKFKIEQVDFCVNPNGVNESGLRSDVRIENNARNGSAVLVVGDNETCHF